MTIYVDNVGIEASVTDEASGRTYNSQWCHLFSDQLDPQELHRFARRIGMKLAWFQTDDDMWKDHYDLTAGKRRRAVQAGAVSVEIDQAVAIWRAKRDRLNEQEA
jgi:Protein of unknown function (DUF4031)